MDIKEKHKRRDFDPPQLSGRTHPAGIDLLKVGVICCLLDDSLTILWGSPGFFRLTGYAMEGFYRLFLSLEEYYCPFPDNFTAIRHEAAQATSTGGPNFDMTIRLPRKADDFSWVRLLGTITTDPAARSPVLQLGLAGVDALAFEKEEQARLCQQQHHCFQSVLNTYEGNAYVSDMDTYEFLYLNHTPREILGMPAVRTVDRKCYEVIQGRTSPCPFYTSCKLSKDNFHKQGFYNPTLGRTFVIKDLGIGWKGHRIRLELSHGMFSAEYKLARKNQERGALINSVHGGFTRVDVRDMGTIFQYGDGFLDLIGYIRNEFKQMLHSQCTYMHPDDIVHITDIMDQSKVTGKPTAAGGCIVIYRSVFKILVLPFSFISAQDGWDGIPSYYSAGLDVTKERMEQARQRQVLEDACETARIAGDTKTNFLSSMSHDIRAPMNVIVGISVITQSSLNSPDRIQDYLAKTSTSSHHLLSLINEILDMSKIESGKIDLIYKEVSLPKLTEDVADAFHPLVAEKYQTLQVNANRVHHEYVVTDKGRLQQVLVNLLSNAVKHTPEGRDIRLRVQETPSSAEDRGQYSFVITDSGTGIHEDFISHVLEPSSRANDARINNIQGTSLGMAVTQNIVRMMNGTIEIKNTPGKGSQFVVIVTFDLCSGPKTDDGELARLPVLVADNDQAMCESVPEILNELGMQCSWVLSDREAVDRVIKTHEQSGNFFAMALDWIMPDIGGLETLKLVRTRVGPDIPVIIISAYGFSEIENRFRLVGADAFITKPLFKSKIVYVFQKFRRNDRSESRSAIHTWPNVALNDKKFLLAEDNEFNREIAMELLKIHGPLIGTADNSLMTVDRFRISAPGEYTYILMDIQVPVMDGYKATRTVRALEHEDAHTIPILALTANAFASDIGRAHSVGINDHIAKPIDVKLLMEALGQWIGQSV